MSFNISKTISAAIILCMLLSACGGKSEKNTNTQVTKEEKTETKPQTKAEATPTIAALTAEQIKTVGITYGTVEMNELTATIKAN